MKVVFIIMCELEMTLATVPRSPGKYRSSQAKAMSMFCIKRVD